MSKHVITTIVNGEPMTAEIESRMLLCHLLREVFGLTGTHIGCDTTSCGACTVLLDGLPIKSCTYFGVMADGHEITTVEGLGLASELHPVQEGFHEEHGLQCGFCTPGFVVSVTALLEQYPEPTEDQIREGLSGNICRCTGYQNIVDAVRAAAGERRRERR